MVKQKFQEKFNLTDWLEHVKFCGNENESEKLHVANRELKNEVAKYKDEVNRLNGIISILQKELSILKKNRNDENDHKNIITGKAFLTSLTRGSKTSVHYGKWSIWTTFENEYGQQELVLLDHLQIRVFTT